MLTVFIYFFKLLRCSWHTISYTIKIVQLNVLTSSYVWTHDICIDSLSWIHYIQKFSHAPYNAMKCTFHVLLPAMPQPLLSVTSFLLLSLWISLHFLKFYANEITYHVLCLLGFSLAIFIQHNHFKIHSCCCIFISSFLFIAE